jgi:hypothetical protein
MICFRMAVLKLDPTLRRSTLLITSLKRAPTIRRHPGRFEVATGPSRRLRLYFMWVIGSAARRAEFVAISPCIRVDVRSRVAQTRTRSDEAGAQSVVLRVCQEMCNGTKHLGTRPGASHDHIDTTIVPGGPTFMDCFIDNGVGTLVSGRMLAHQCIAEWVSILESHGLATARLS